MPFFIEMEKGKKEEILPTLFDLYYENMCSIAPFDASYGNERAIWIACIAEALEKPQRRILLCVAGDQIVAFAQYYTREDMVMIEELQIRRDYQRTILFLRLARKLAACLPEECSVLEAYADRRNQHSLRMMERLGMQIVDRDDRFCHLRGNFGGIKKIFIQ